MKHLKYLFTPLLLFCCLTATAHDFEVDGIYYNITDATNKTIEVTYRGTSYSEYSNEYTGSVVIPESVTYNGTTYSVTSIGDEAFYNCTGLTSITIPNSVTSIGDEAFYNCTGLTSITIPNSVKSIGSEAFYRCKGLTSVVIGNSVTSIGEHAFYYCQGLTSITIPNSVTSIGDGAFAHCSGLTNIIVESGNMYYDSRDNCNAIIETTTNTLLAGCQKTIIPNDVTSIGDGAFVYCSGLTSITIPNSVTSIGYEAFYNCTGLTSITIPNSVTSIGDYAFQYCTGLTSIEIPNSVTSIGNSVFEYCTGLTSIVIPNSVTSIGDFAFYGCSGLTSVVIPNSVTSIGDYAFSGCSGLTSATIGSGVRYIGSGAFAKCSNLTDVYCLATSVPSTDEDAFDESYPEYMTLHVPAEAINSYKTKAPWSSFGTIVTLDGDVAETPKCANPVIEYNNGKIEIDCETADAEFITTVTNSYTGNYYSNNFELSATYNISVYAMATGYENSETVNATLCWIECECDGSDDTGVINIPAKTVLVTSNNGVLSISCQLDGEVVAVYTTAGTLIGTTTIDNGVATIATGLSKGTVAIVKIADKSIKVIID